MDLSTLDWSLLRSFLAVVDAGSLLGAARRLGSHQPTLSRQIAELESQLGVPLFERTGRGMRPTAAGRAIVEPARAMAGAADAVHAALRGTTSEARGTVRISCSAVMAAHAMPGCLALLRQRHPAIHLDLVASNELSNLLRRDADIAVRMLRPVQSSLRARRLGVWPMGAFASVRYLARRGTPQRLRDLRHHDLIGGDRDDAVLRGLAAAGLEMGRDDFGLRTDDQVTAIRLVEAGGGIGFLPKPVAARLPTLVAVLPRLPMPDLPIWLAVHREIQGNPLIRQVYDHLAETLPGQWAR